MKRLLALASTIALLLLSCAKASHPISAEPPADGGQPIDTDVMAYLSEARAFHHLANLKEDARDPKGALVELDLLVHTKKPHEGATVPEVEEVLADTYARMAELNLRLNELRAAQSDVREGLVHAPERTYFRGHLLEIEGLIEEARAGALLDAGQTSAAAEASAGAAELLRQAIVVQEAVLAHVAGDSGTEGDSR
jgi:hypothetical protein